jgi:hypothetical protein
MIENNIEWKQKLYHFYDNVNDLLFGFHHFEHYRNNNYCQKYIDTIGIGYNNIYRPFDKKDYLELLEKDLDCLNSDNRKSIENKFADLLSYLRKVLSNND